jgi:hypothetical protein
MALQAISNLAAIAGDVARIYSEVNTLLSKGIVIQIENKTRTPLVLARSEHNSGGFNDPPDNTIPPDHVSTFGSKGSLALGVATAGRVTYGGTGLDLSYQVDWDVPLFGQNTGGSRCDGGARQYFVAAASVGAFAVSIAKHELSEKQTQDQWKRCAKCGTLNHQTGGLDAACIAGGTHDNSTSRNYRVISRGVQGVDPWVGKRCTKCECMVIGPIPGPCYAGGLHDLSDPEWYTLVSHPNAPGETGWHPCALCTGIVIDPSRGCASGANHIVAPGPVFNISTS